MVLVVGKKRGDGVSKMGTGVGEIVKRNGFREKEGSGCSVWRARRWREMGESRSEGKCSSHYFSVWTVAANWIAESNSTSFMIILIFLKINLVYAFFISTVVPAIVNKTGIYIYINKS